MARYLLAPITTAAAVVITFAIRPLVNPSLTPPFILAVAIAALYGGWGPGALASILSVVALATWFFPPFGSDTAADVARLLLFLTVALVTSWIAGSVIRRREEALRHSAESERLRHLAEEAAAEAEMATQQALDAGRQAEDEARKATDAALEAELAAQDAAEALVRQQEAEASLRRSEEELSDFFDTASTGLHWVDEQGTIIRVNQAELDMLGYSREECLGHPVADFHVDRPVIEEMLRRLLNGENIREHSARLRCKDGQIKHVMIDSSGYFVNGRFLHTRCFIRDVTLERQAQEAISRLAAIVTSSNDAIVGKTLDGVITSWNEAAERIFGYRRDEIVGSSIFKLIPPEHHDQEREILERLRRGEPVAFSEAERIRSDGRRIWISLSVSPVRDQTGAIIGAASIKRDVTDRKLLEERLRDTQRLQAVGQLAGGIAHEANNQMSVVLGGSHFLLRRKDLPEGARTDLEQIRRAAERTAAITQQLLAFSRRQRLQIEDVDLNAVIESIGPMLRRTLTENQRLVVELGSVGGFVRADARQLEQVLLNMTLNARDAMTKGGELTLQTGEVVLDPDGAGAGGNPRRYVRDGHDTGYRHRDGSGHTRSPLRALLHDEGGGARHRTRDVGRSRNREPARRAHPGRQHARTRHHVPAVLPRCLADETRAPGRPSSPHFATSGAVTLVVEDDPQVRGMTARALSEAGYTVLEASSGGAALDLIRAHRGRLDLVLSDIGMPGMDGYQLARHLQQERPGLPVMLMTGYGDGAQRPGTLARGIPVIHKPFSPDDLARTVGELLAGREPGV